MKKGDTAPTIALRLDRLMAQRRISVEELSRRTGISRVNLSRLRGRHTDGIRFATLAALCVAHECGPGDLLSCERATAPDDDAVPSPARSATQAAILEVITAAGAAELEELVARTGLTATEAGRCALELELSGCIARGLDGHYRLRLQENSRR